MRKIDRDILNIAVPSIVANITTPLLGLVDMAIVGHMGSAVYMAAIALGGTMFSMIYWVFAFLRMGTSGMTAQAVGAGDVAQRDASLFRAMSVAMGMGLLLIVLQLPLCGMMLHFFGGEDEAAVMAARYFDVLIYGAPATLGLYVVNGWMIGVQNSRLTMWTSLIINVVNIGASLTLVYLLHLGIEGVASGTLIAQWTGFVAGCLMIRRYRPRLGSSGGLFERDKLRRFFSVNTDIFLRTLCLVAVTVWFTRAGARQGDVILSVNALLMQAFHPVLIYDGWLRVCRRGIGGKTDRSRRCDAEASMVRRLFVIGGAVSLTFTLAYAIFGDDILGLLSSDASVIEMSRDYMLWGVTIPLAGVSAFIWDGVFIGETRTRQMLLSMGVAMVVFFAVYFTLYPLWGNHALWLAFILYLAVRGAVQTVFYFRRF